MQTNVCVFSTKQSAFTFAFEGRRYVFRERVVRFFNENRLAIDIAPNAVLLWDNYRVLHARTGYTNPRRHLRRVWISE